VLDHSRGVVLVASKWFGPGARADRERLQFPVRGADNDGGRVSVRVLKANAGGIGVPTAASPADSRNAVVVDRDPARVERLTDEADTPTVRGDGTDIETLREAKSSAQIRSPPAPTSTG
jgi:hypothetical protein